MPLPKPHFVVGGVRMAIALHRLFHDQSPRQVLVGLMDMAALEQARGRRSPAGSMIIDGVPVAVGGLKDMAHCVA